MRVLSAGLAGIGARPEDRVVLWLTNTLEWVVSHLACLRLGGVTVPVNILLKPAEISYLIAQSVARHLVMIDGFRSLRMADMLAEICPGYTLARVILLRTHRSPACGGTAMGGPGLSVRCLVSMRRLA